MTDRVLPELPERTIMKKAQKSRNVTQDVIADRLGIKRNSLCQNMNRQRMSLNVFADVLSALDYDIVIVDRETGEEVWKLSIEREFDDDV